MTLFKKTPEQMQKINVFITRVIHTLDEMYPAPTKEDKAYVAYALSKITAQMVNQWSDADVAAFMAQWLGIIKEIREGRTDA